ncbi:class I SAM-dependent methyltransferase [Rhizobium pusense]|uniref:class I SAM-dependent methyltransferase n=1 Tax=Agrobacterium pusense TaxID=648995 RepID=UPI00244C8EC5|nr:class I SAM-dependent methyltransferase [Agrobacterium pusense]MDH0115373.1 class I SAM-dependent methyltransferase [Agrobacterium pusense]
MSRLDSFIRRLTAQRDILNHVAANLDMPHEGALMEIGLGNGRTFNHLRELFPGRRIIAFDRAMGAHASSVPADEDLVIGEISQTAPAFVGAEAAMVHADIGTGYPEKDAITLTWLPDLAAGMLAKGGVAVSGLPLDHPLLKPLPIPESVPTDRYFLCRKI